jgi:hypothetical protein
LKISQRGVLAKRCDRLPASSRHFADFADFAAGGGVEQTLLKLLGGPVRQFKHKARLRFCCGSPFFLK